MTRMAGSPKDNVRAIDQRAHGTARNPGMDYDADRFASIRINRSAVERRAATIGTRRSLKKAHQAAPSAVCYE